ncbi:hypothetical protein LNQ81_16785 [Myroides sp. M-43]|uniref:hypothetical protein n=1 Tax=Myroides oncorhynchi TaxID=2893756 RepID=UPI001E44E064|nr:hypothetical protein [Myroides oncorhynchi]MCC9044331.1 hypothetical protein [Myroides oncorhynchi]
MTPIISLILVLIIQIIGYIFFYKKGIKGWRYALFLPLLFIMMVVLPPIFVERLYPMDEFSSNRCGMVDLGVYLFFIMYGVIGLVFVHLIFWVGNKYLLTKKK